MIFPFSVYLAAFVSATATVAVAVPLWRKWCVRNGLVDEPGPRKIHEQPVALAGGLAVMTGLLLPTAIAFVLLWWGNAGGEPRVPPVPSLKAHAALHPPLDPYSVYLLRYGLNRRSTELGCIFLGALGMLLVGWWDDKRELRPAAKFAGQLFVATLVALGGARVTLFVHNLLFQYTITILWVLTVINAFNFVDNMNGLCAGLAAIGAWYFALVAAADDQYLVASIAFMTFGALLGFLPYNFPKARVFLGDSGSHLVGYLLAVLAILPHFYTTRHPRPLAVLIPLLVLAVPLVDLVQVVILRWRIGQPFYQGDTNHLSHRLVRLGWSRSRAVVVLWLAAAGAGALVCLC